VEKPINIKDFWNGILMPQGESFNINALAEGVARNLGRIA